jgi:PAS domain S-box-containing protein
VATFWYRRVCEIALFLSIIVASLWIVSTYTAIGPIPESFIVSVWAFGAAVVTLVLAVANIIWRSHQTSWSIGLVVMALSVTVLLSVESTGNLESPYYALIVLVAIFSAVAGLLPFFAITTVFALYGTYLWQQLSPSPEQWLSIGLTMFFPLLLGLFIWSRRFQIQDKSNQAVSELAHELTQESSKSEIITNAIADGVILIDAKGIIQLINPAAERIIGWGSEDATRLDYRSVLKIIDIKNDIVEGQLDPVQQCLSTNQSVITDKLGIRTVSGKQLLASIMVSPLSDNTSGVVVVFRDITAQRAEERGQAEFISTASHEMRTPVAAIEGYLGLALNPQTAAIDEKARLYLGKAQESAKHLGRLFQDLLDISRVEDGRLANNPTVVDVTAYVHNVLDDFSGQFAEKGLSVKFTPDIGHVAPVFYATVDRDHLHEIVSNLFTNALKYTKEGSVAVDITGDNDHVYIMVKDSGIGIPAEDLPHLFQKFYRVDNTDTREIGGTGLGLYLSRRLAEAMGGHLTVQSVYGEGSTFTVELPRTSKESAEAAQATPATQTTPVETKL